MIENPGVQALIGGLSQSKYDMPSLTVLAGRASDMAKDVKVNIRNELRPELTDGTIPSLVLDCWNDCEMRSYLSVRARWVSPHTYELKAKTLAVHPCPFTATTEALATIIKAVMDDYGITDDCCWYGVTDGSPGLELAITPPQFLGMQRVLAASQWLQNAVIEAIAGEHHTLPRPSAWWKGWKSLYMCHIIGSYTDYQYLYDGW